MDWEYAALDFIRENFTCPFLDATAKIFDFLGYYGWIFIVAALVLTAVKKTRRLGFVLALSLIINAAVVNIVLKPVIARERPYELNNVVLIVQRLSDYSFPSGHTSAAFAFSTALWAKKRRAVFWLATVFSVLMGLSRLYLYVHFPTDVIGGAVIGILCGIASIIIFKKQDGQNETDEAAGKI